MKKFLRASRRFTILILLTLLFGYSLSCRNEQPAPRNEQTATPAPKDNSADSEYLKNAGAEWDKLFEAGDTVSLGTLYAENAISMPYNYQSVQGRRAIQAELEKFLSQNTARHETFTEEILQKDDWAIERARYIMTYTPKNASNRIVETGRHVMCRRKIDGRWQIVWEIWNSDQPFPK